MTDQEDVDQMRESADRLGDSMRNFSEMLDRGLFRSTWQGLIMVVVGVFISFSLLGYAFQPATCDPESLLKHEGTVRDRICETVFPGVRQQKETIADTRDQLEAARKAAEKREAEFRELQEKVDKLNEIAEYFLGTKG